MIAIEDHRVTAPAVDRARVTALLEVALRDHQVPQDRLLRRHLHLQALAEDANINFIKGETTSPLFN